MTETKTYTKINTLYKRFSGITKNNCPNPKWLKWKNKIILGLYSDEIFHFLCNNLFEAYSKIDGTNSKIVYFPSTGEIQVGGKTDNAQNQHGQFEYLQAIADKILPSLKEMYPPECAKFIPETDKNNQTLFYERIKTFDEEEEFFTVRMVESPIYIYGEYYGSGIQKVGGSYSKENHFAVFDICQQEWWLPSDMRHDICEKLNLDEVPRLDNMTLAESERLVKEGFPTHVQNAVDPNFIEEGLVLRPIIPIKNSRGKRIIVKVKHCDYHEYNMVRKEFKNEEMKEFLFWYFTEIEPIEPKHIHQLYQAMYEPFNN